MTGMGRLTAMSRMRAILRSLTHRIHERLLGTGIGERTSSALHGAAWVTGAAMIARVLTGVTTLLTARWLGPEDWGRANLALAASMWLQIPLFLGLPTAILNTVPRAAPGARGAWARTASLLLFAVGLLTLAGGFALRVPLAKISGMGVEEFSAGLAWCAGIVIYSAAITLLSSLERFRARAVAEVAFALAYPAGVVALHVTGSLSWRGYVWSMAFGYALAGLAKILFARVPLPAIEPGTAERARHLLSLGVIAVGSSLALALIHALGRQVTHLYFPIDQVGVLSAYQGGSLQMAMYMQGVLTMVFFPVASRTPDRRGLFRKMSRLLAPLSLAASAAFAVLLVVWMSLLGREFPLDALLVATFAIAAGLTTSFGFVAWVLASGGRGGIASSTVAWLVTGAVNAAACVLLVPRLGVLGAGVAVVIGTLAGIGAGFLPPLRRWADVD